MQAFWQQIISGIANGGIYAALALALVVVYRVSGHVNFAQGEMATFSTFIALTLLSIGLPLWLTVAVTVALSFLMGMVIERLLIRPFEHKPPLMTFTVVLGLLIFFNAITGLVWGSAMREFPSMVGDGLIPSNTFLNARQFANLVITGSLLGMLYIFFSRTRTGLAMRAAALNPNSSWLVGIPVERMRGVGWGLAAALGAVAGILIAPSVYLDPNMMMGVLIYAFAGAKLGGMDHPIGAVVGGFAIGVIENLLGVYLVGSQLKLTAAVALIVITLLFFPQGLFTKVVGKRV